MLPLTGPSASIGELLREGYQFKADQFSEQGILVHIYIQDSASDPKQAISAFNNLVDVHKVLTVVTGVSSGSMVLKPIVEQRKNVILWADSTHPALTQDTSFVLRHASTAQDGARMIVESIIKQGAKKVGILFQQDEWGVILNQMLIEDLKRNGIDSVSETLDNKDSDFRSQISKLKSANPDAIVYGVLCPAIGTAIKQTREMGYKGQLYSGVGFGIAPEAQRIAGEYAKGLIYQKYKLSSQFSVDYKKRYGTDASPLGYVTYTDLELMVYAVQQTKSNDPAVIIRFIKNLGSFKGTYESVSIESNGDIIIPTMMEVW